MKNVILFLLSATFALASNVNPTAPITELQHYGADFTDTDGDGMTDVAELRYGFDPNDRNSFPSKDYTFLSGNEPTLHTSKGVTDPMNEIRFEFTESEYRVNRKGTSNLDKLRLDREMINLAMPILLDELGPPPDSFIVKISCQNRGVYANGTRISVNDDSPPQSFIHEIGHVWKSGWNYSFMKLRGAKRSYFRGFEEGFAEALTFIVLNKFAEAYPTHSLVKSKIVTSKNSQTWRGQAYDFDVTFGEPSFKGGTFWGDKFTQWRYENSAGAFTVLSNQREGLLKELFRAFYLRAENNPNWDWTLNANDIFEVWEQVIPKINGIDTSEWLTNARLFDGKPVPQRLYVSVVDGNVFLLYPDTQGNFSWKHSSLSSQNIPSWFPTKNVSGKLQPNVANLSFNVGVETINGESVLNVTKVTGTKNLGQTSVSEIQPKVLPIGLYRVAVEFPSFAKHTNNNKTTRYVFGEKHSVHPKDKLSVHVGLDIPNVDDIEISLGDSKYKTSVTNGLAVFRFDDVGIDHSGMVTISVSANGKTNKYERAISHFGLSSGQRVNQFLIVDLDFDNIEDAFDTNVIPISQGNFVSYSEIRANASLLANPTTEKVIETKPRPKLPVAPPVAPPSVSNPIDDLKKEIAFLENRVTELIEEKAELTSNHSKIVGDLNEKIESLDILATSEALRVKLITAERDAIREQNNNLLKVIQDLETRNAELSKNLAKINSDKKELQTDRDSDLKKIASLEKLVIDLNESVEELNSTIQVLDVNLTKQNQLVEKFEADKNSLVSENTRMQNKIIELERKVVELQTTSDEKTDINVQLNNRVNSLTSELSKATNENVSLVNNVNDLNVHIEDLTLELKEAIRVAQVPFTSGWFFDPEDGWLYTDADTFPLVYKHSNETWYFYELGSHGPRYFFSYKTNQWEEWE